MASPSKRSKPFMIPDALENSKKAIVTDTGKPETSCNQSEVNPALSIQSSFRDIKLHIDEHEKSLRNFIQEELQILNKTLSGEVQTSKDEVLGTHANIEQYMGKHDRNHENIIASLERHDLNHEDIQKSLQRQDAFLEDILNACVDGGRPPTRSKIAALSATPNEFSKTLNSSPPAPRMNGELDGKHELTPKLKHEHTFTPAAWTSFMNKVNDCQLHETSRYQAVLERKLNERSFWHDVAETMGLSGLLHVEMPETVPAKITEHPLFFTTQTVLIVVNTILTGYEADLQLKATMQDPPGNTPHWIRHAEIVFSTLFTLELLWRIYALRTWFFVAPYEWGWNFFDFAVVVVNVLAEVLTGINIAFLRTFRVLRAVRVVRLIRVLRFFRKLRQMFFAILACLNALVWAFIFMALLIYMFSILFLQGMVHTLEDLDRKSEDSHALRSAIQLWFPSLPHAMVSLLAAVTGGADWINVRAPLEYGGILYSGAFIVYVLFITIGVMNVLTGVFLNSANEFTDLTLVVQSEELKVEDTIDQILELFKVLDVDHDGRVDWASFRKMLEDARVWSFFASLQMEPTHIRLMFDLFADYGSDGSDGTISVQDLVTGIVRLKGEAKAIDARIIQRELAMLPLLLKTAFMIHDADQRPDDSTCDLESP